MKRRKDIEMEKMRKEGTGYYGTMELIQEYPNLTEQEARILHEWNDTRVEYPSGKCIHHLFEEQVMRSPDAIAVVFEEDQATYAELNAMANRLAHYLVNQGAEEDTDCCLLL